jgi:hypothetical protein
MRQACAHCAFVDRDLPPRSSSGRPGGWASRGRARAFLARGDRFQERGFDAGAFLQEPADFHQDRGWQEATAGEVAQGLGAAGVVLIGAVAATSGPVSNTVVTRSASAARG